jgi:hypothetical protein
MKLLIFVAKYYTLSYVLSYFGLVGFWLLTSRSNNDCTVGEEIAEGCSVVFPDTYLFLAVINLTLAVLPFCIVSVIKLSRHIVDFAKK